MNFVAWLANMVISGFGFESDMAKGLSVAISVFVLFTLMLTFSIAVVKIAEVRGWFENI